METRPPSTTDAAAVVSNTTTTTTTTTTTASTTAEETVNDNNKDNDKDTDNKVSNSNSIPKKGAVRHAEKRRTATCHFSNRVAALSVQHYRTHVSRKFQQTQKQTCLATIVAHERIPIDDCKTAAAAAAGVRVDPKDGTGTALPAATSSTTDRLTVVGMGVGTKFLSEAVLQESQSPKQHQQQQQQQQQRTDPPKDDAAAEEESYGSRVRDCHAEVLARRAFRCHLSLEMKRLLVQQMQQQQSEQQPPDPIDGSILECCWTATTAAATPRVAFRLRPGVTLHLYTSSAPCGNACLKKFANLSHQAEVFRPDLYPNEWPVVNECDDTTHEYTPGHSIPLGQFALLVKKDSSSSSSSSVSSLSYEDYTRQQQQRINSSNNNSNHHNKKRGRADGGSKDNVANATVSMTTTTASTVDAGATTTTAVGASNTVTTVGAALAATAAPAAAAASDRTTAGTDNDATSNPRIKESKRPGGGKKSKSPAHYPANLTDTWCPPGTTTVWSGKGSLHTCSDKICRWNCLGLQGSLLASLLLLVESKSDDDDGGDDDDDDDDDDPTGDHQQHNNQSPLPLYLSTVTVGRKLTPVVCRRALCCRVGPTNHHGSSSSSILPGQQHPYMRLHHPTVMGTSVYMDDTGVIDMSNKDNNNNSKQQQTTGQDVRFHSTLSWAWWPALSVNGGNEAAECIDGATGWAILPRRLEGERDDDETDTNVYDDNSGTTRSMVSTASLLELYLQIDQAIQQWTLAANSNHGPASAAMKVEVVDTKIAPQTLTELRCLKKQVSRPYEDAKEHLLTKHPVLRQWKRRENHSTGSRLTTMEVP